VASSLVLTPRQRAWLERLPPRRRLATILRVAHGLSDAEIADILGVPASTVTALVTALPTDEEADPPCLT
jgi:DNA-directed RNA polymerase specialized sigma24 family protein